MIFKINKNTQLVTHPALKQHWHALKQRRHGTIRLRGQHFIGGRGQKSAKFADIYIIVKKLPTRGGKGQKSWKFADVLNGWSPCRISKSKHVLFSNMTWYETPIQS